MTLRLRSIIDKSFNTERTLAITTKIGCINNCAYCPQSVFVKAYKQRSDITLMTLNDYKTCLSKVPEKIIISFAGFSEPWLNPNCTSMVLHTHEKGYLIRVNTTGIGMLPSDIEKISHIPFRKFVIHLPDDKGITKLKVDANYLDVIEKIAISDIKSILWKFHNTSPGVKVHPEVLEILDKYKLQITNFGLSNRATNISSDANGNITRKTEALSKCKDFHHNILFPNGDVGLCHMDWSLRHIIGNLISGNFESLYKGAEFERVLNGLKDNSLDITCRLCEKSVSKKRKVMRFISFGTNNRRTSLNMYDD